MPQAALNHARSHGAWDWSHVRPPRQPLMPHVARRVAGWHPPTAAALTVLAGLVVHEAAYHASGADDFPLEVLFNDTHVFVMSHGGLDVLLSGIVVVVVLLLIDAAQIAGVR